MAVNSGKNNQKLQPINAAKRKKKKNTTTNQKIYQLFQLNNTNHWGFTVRTIFPFCLILHCSK